MDKSQPRRFTAGRIIELLVLALAMFGFTAFGYWLGRLDRPPEPPPAPQASPAMVDQQARAVAEPEIDAPRPTVLQKPEPQAVEARAKAILSAKEAILTECRNAAGGDWDRWERETEPFRAQIKARMAVQKPFDPIREYWLKDRPQALAGKDGFPLFEVYPREGIQYLYDADSIKQFQQDRAVVAASLWLNQRGIDLIYVDIPNMTEVYIEHFVDSCPADGIVAPHVRRAMHDLLMEDVEVVDGFPLFRREREPNPEYLFNTADTHWAPRGMRIMAREVAKRIKRYGFGEEARSSAPIVKTAPQAYDIQHALSKIVPGSMPNQDGWWTLTADEQKRATAVQTKTIEHVTMPGGTEPPENPKSPVLLIGHSYLLNFRELLIKEANLLPRSRMGAGQTTESFGDFLRQPEILDGCKVVIWITTNKYLPRYAKIPRPIMRVLEGG
jgi:hypothetical protein